MARVIAVSNLKGGSGKTTSAVNIAAALALQGKSVLLVDTDPQAHASFCLGVATPGGRADLAAVLMGSLSAGQAIVPTSSANVLLIPASRRLISYERHHVARREARSHLAAALRTVESRFEYIIVDTPPTLGLLTVSALVASGEIVIPMQAHVLGMRGLMEMVQLVYRIKKHYNQALELTGVIPTFYNAHARLSASIVAEIAKRLGQGALLPPVRTNIALAEAPRLGKSIFGFSKQSSGAVDYLRVAHAIERAGARRAAAAPQARPEGEAASAVSLPGETPILTIPGREPEGESPSV